jgi:hypothetical protein
MTKTMLKGSPEYSVTKDGVEIARAHCVNVPANLFTLTIRGKWSGVGPEAVVVAKLEEMDK